MKAIFNENLPKGHYSPGMISGNTFYISGQTSEDIKTGKPAEGGFKAEVLMALQKMESILKAGGCSKEHVVMCKIYITDMDNWGQANEVYKEFFGEHKPARIVLPVVKLNKGCQVELEVVAELNLK